MSRRNKILLLKVALRKESVDRNNSFSLNINGPLKSLSARRAWIEIFTAIVVWSIGRGRSPQGERG